jgi:ACS family sodium-dependent inorganic phosphate cotransporter
VRTWDWPLPFYLFGAVGFAWAVVWFRKVGAGQRDDASAAATAAGDGAGSARSIPWGRLLSSRAVWAIIVNHFCHNWSLYVLLAWLPSYFKTTFSVSLANASLLSAAPWVASFVMANVAGAWSDRLIRAGRSAGFVRKLMQTIGLGGVALFLLQLPGAASASMAVVLMCGATGALAFCLAGFAPNCFDIAPKYADVIWGISNTAATLPGIVGVFVTGWLIDRTGSYAAPFLLSAGLAAAGAIVFLVYGSGERQID